MTYILIIDTNSPDLNAAALVHGKLPMGEMVADGLRELGDDIDCDVVEPYDAPVDWDAVAGYDGILFTGAFVDWNVADPQAAPIHAAWDWAAVQGLPIWGSCNGMQLAAFMLGGGNDVSPNGVEVGLARGLIPTGLIPTGLVPTGHPMMAGRQAPFTAPCSHLDQVTRLPSGAVIIAQNAHSPVQAMAVETPDLTFWGTQYHPELRPDQIRFWVHLSGGTCPIEDDPADRTLELRNWLTLLCARGENLGD